MSKVVLDMAMSLDGIVAATDNSDNGLYDWYFAEVDDSADVKNELLESVGAMILGKGAFGDQPDGFDTPYKVPHFVLCHEPRETVSRDGMQFIFVTEGIEHALQLARAAAGDKDVCVAGGAETARQFLNVGLIDEIELHLVPVVLGDGIRLFDQTRAMKLEQTRVVEKAGVTHLRFAIIKQPITTEDSRTL